MSHVRRRASTAVVILVLASCRAIVGVEDRDPPTEPCASSSPWGSAACRACAEDPCCAEVEACIDDAACSALEDCRATCGAGDAACRDTCADGAPPTQAASALDLCLARGCEEACELRCGGAGSPVLGCEPCGEACCAEGRACATSADCADLRACRDACGQDVPCREACTNTHVEGASLALAVDECLTRACDLTAEWSCLGRVVLPTTSQASVTFTYVALDVVGEPLAGLTVTACSEASFTCDVVLAEGVTDPDGVVQLELPIEPFSGSFAGYIEAEGGGILPTRTFFSPPIAQSRGHTDFLMTPEQLFETLASQGVLPDVAKGLIFVLAADCLAFGAAGVGISGEGLGGTVEPLYGQVVGEPFSEDRTTATATALFIDVPPGAFVVEGEVRSLCQPLGSAYLQVQGGMVTKTVLEPMP